MGKIVVFKDQALNDEFIENGFVKLNLFNKKEYSNIKKITTSIINKEANTSFDFMTIPHQETSDDECIELHSYFKNLIEKKIYAYLSDNYKFFSSCLFFKKTRSNELLWHKDPTFFNMGTSNVVSIWSGIDKTNINNGCFRLVPKSHKLSFNYEAFPFKPLGETLNTISLGNTYRELINKYAIDIPLKKGEVIIHDYNILHASRPNNSYFKKRIAYKINLYPKDVNTYEVAYYHSNTNKLEIFEVADQTLKKNSSVFNNYNNIKKLKDKNELWLKREEELDVRKASFKTLADMEAVMDKDISSLKAKFESF